MVAYTMWKLRTYVPYTQVAGRLGIPYNSVSLPLLLSAVYGKRPPRMVMLLRNPVERWAGGDDASYRSGGGTGTWWLVVGGWDGERAATCAERCGGGGGGLEGRGCWEGYGGVG